MEYVIYDRRRPYGSAVTASNLDEVHDIIMRARRAFVKTYGYDYVEVFDENVKYSRAWAYRVRMDWPLYLLALGIGMLMAVV